jgi:hypothetical protein
MAFERKRFGLRTGEWIALSVIVAMIALFVVPDFASPPRKSRHPKNWCINNLRQIDGAKEQWALENKRSTNDPAIESEIVLYIKGGLLPICPEGGKYILGKAGEPPRCTFPQHANLLP